METSASDGFKPLVKQKGRPREPHAVGEFRECARHGYTEFGFYGRGRNQRARCKQCIAAAVTRRHRKLRLLLVAEAGGACQVCGYDRCLLNLHFHHVDPTTKAFPMTMARGKSEAGYREELRKCVLVCANCHGEIESGVIESPPSIGQQQLAASRALVDR